MIFILICCLIFAFSTQGSSLFDSSLREFHWEKVYDEPLEYEDEVVPAKVGISTQNDEVYKRDGPIELINFDAAAIRKCVENTNSYRRKHEDTPDLIWDAVLARGAQEWANHLLTEVLREKKFVFYHAAPNLRPGAGENLYWNVVRGDCSGANKAWHSEVKDYNFHRNRPKPGKGFHNIAHFSQLVWKGTRRFGIGIAKGNFGKYYRLYRMPQYFVVGRYSPPGNVAGSFKSNIGQLI